MKKIDLRLLAVAMALLILSACGGNSAKEIAVTTELQKMMKAKASAIGKGVVVDAVKGKQNNIVLTFTGLERKDVDERAASSAAYYFYQNDTPAAYKYDVISVNLSMGDTTLHKTYSVDDIRLADSLATYPAARFFRWFDSDSLSLIFDPRMPDTALHTLVNFMHSADSTYGKIDGLGFAGWVSSPLHETGEPLLIYYFAKITGNYSTDFAIAVSLKTRKIVNVTGLDWPHPR